MLKAKSFLAADFGAANLKVAEFEVSESGGLLLRQYGIRSLGAEGFAESGREAGLSRALQELLAEKGFASRQMNVCAPGFNTFSKFVKLPPVDTSKVTQIIQYEAQQNVPFPLEEVVWDYQILGAAPSGELEVLLVAIKTDVVEGLFRAVENAGCRLQLADVSPAALGNAFRYNYGDLEGCTMVLDIGAKTSNLIFFQKGTMYSRGINIGAHTITTDFARESKLPFAEAEQIKINEGFVSLGGAYEEPENPHQAAISKIARQVMTRLHIQVNQTVQFYRQQQAGSQPDRLFLAGGASIMPYTAQFFSEKLNVPVEYFNPLRNVDIDPALDREELVKVAHSLGEVVGLGLRNLAHCPVELNLMPASSVRRQEITQKKPYFIASLCSLLLVFVAFGFFYDKVSAQKAKALEKLTAQVTPLQQNEAALRKANQELKTEQSQLTQFQAWLLQRSYWGKFLSDLRAVFTDVERQKEQEFKAKTGVWIERMVVLTPAGPVKISGPVLLPSAQRPTTVVTSQPQSSAPAKPPTPARATPQAEGLWKDLVAAAAAQGSAAPVPAPAPTPGAPPPRAPTVAASSNAISQVQLFCRGVNRTDVTPDANTKLAFAVSEALKAREDLADATGTELFGGLQVAADQMTFTFQIQMRLRQPFEF